MNASNLTAPSQNTSLDCPDQYASRNSTAYYQEANSLAVITVYPIFLLIGIPGNLMTLVVVLRQKKSATFVSMTLFVIAISDNLHLLSSCLVDWVKALCGYDFKTSGNIPCQIHMFCVVFTVIVSAWGLVAITLARVASLVKPFTARRVLNATYSLQVQAGVLVVATLQSSGVFWLYEVFDDTSYAIGVTCNIRNETGMLAMAWKGSLYFLGLFAPVIIMVIGNSIIVFKLTRMKMVSSNLNDVEAKSRKRRMGILVVILNVIFLASQSPMAANLMLNASIREWVSAALCVNMEQYYYRVGIAELFLSFCLCMIFVNPSVNFILYSVSSAEFRKEIQACFCVLESGSKPMFTDF